MEMFKLWNCFWFGLNVGQAATWMKAEREKWQKSFTKNSELLNLKV